MSIIHWSSAVDGDWNTAADWNGGVPGAGDDTFIDALGTYTLTISSAEAARSLTIDDAGATVACNNTLSIGTTLTVSAGTFQLNGGSNILGGILSAPGGAFAWNGGVLTGVTYQGTLDLSGASAIVHVMGGLTVTGAGGAGPGTIDVTGAGATLGTAGGTLDNATLNLGSTTPNANTAIVFEPAGDFNPILILGSNLNIVHTGGYAVLEIPDPQEGEYIINNGSITAGVSGSQFLIFCENFTNNGVLSVKNGDKLFLNCVLTNLASGVLSGGNYEVGSNSTLTLDFEVNTDDATIVLDGANSVFQANISTGATVIESSLTAIGSNGTLKILGGRNYTTANAIASLGILELGGGTLTSGTLTCAAGSTLSGFGTVASTISEAGTVTASGGALSFTGSGNAFSGALGGSEIDFAGGTDLLQAGSSLTASVVGVSGGAVVTLTGDQSLTGTLVQAGGTTIAVGANNLSLYGAGASLAGSVTGSGTLYFGGGTQAIDAGAAFSIANWILSATAASLNTSLAYAGNYTQAADASLTVASGDVLTLSGPAFLSGTIEGAGAVHASNAVIKTLTLGGTLTLKLTGTADQLTSITIGDGTSDAATLSVGAAATYTLSNDSDINRGAAAQSKLTVAGHLIKSGATGTSVVQLKTTDNGVIEAANGTLDLTRALKGTGVLLVDHGATLEVDRSATASLTATFSAAGATLALARPARFAATITGFTAGDVIDLLNTAATTASLGAGDTLVIKNGAATVAKLQLNGGYAGDTFNVSSDGQGGSNVTVTTPDEVAEVPIARHRFIAAMAGLAGSAGGAIHFDRAAPVHEPMLSKPRAMIA
jgi:fibronectin-binding autotransporter adhesin